MRNVSVSMLLVVGMVIVPGSGCGLIIGCVCGGGSVGWYESDN